MEDHFDLDQEFDIVELEPRGAASPDGQTVVVANNIGSGSIGIGSGSGSSGSGSSGSGSIGSGGSGGSGSGGGSGT